MVQLWLRAALSPHPPWIIHKKGSTDDCYQLRVIWMTFSLRKLHSKKKRKTMQQGKETLCFWSRQPAHLSPCALFWASPLCTQRPSNRQPLCFPTPALKSSPLHRVNSINELLFFFLINPNVGKDFANHVSLLSCSIWPIIGYGREQKRLFLTAHNADK